MDSQQHLTHILEHRDIKPTAMRLLVLRAMLESDEAFSLLSLEQRLDTVDKSTIYRCITLFLTHHLLHAIFGGNPGKAALRLPDGCGGEVQEHDESAVSFYCERCHRTYCLSRIHVPVVSLPGNFQVHNINYVLKGICSHCTSKDNQ